MKTLTTTFAISDPRDFDGDCFEVAERGLKQAAGLANLLGEAIKPARLMARNAEMERQLIATGECSAADFEAGAQARKISDVQEAIATIEKQLRALSMAAGYNPKKPLKP